MGKNYSRNNASGKRKASDLYETPFSLSQEFLNYCDWEDSPIIDPCAGNGAIVKVLQKNKFIDITQHDLLADGVDFLQDFTKRHYIFSNPPYSLANEFILHAKKVCEEFAFLLPLTYLQGSYRYNNIWTDNDFPLKSVGVFNRYPMLGEPLREDGMMSTGMQAYAWYLWDKYYIGAPTIYWIDIDKYILKKEHK